MHGKRILRTARSLLLKSREAVPQRVKTLTFAKFV